MLGNDGSRYRGPRGSVLNGENRGRAVANIRMVPGDVGGREQNGKTIGRIASITLSIPVGIEGDGRGLIS